MIKMSTKRLLIILVGPQGSGKTTQAIMLKAKFSSIPSISVTITEAVHYTVIARLWYKFLMILTERKIKYKFYADDESIHEFIDPYLLKKIFRLDAFIHILSGIISLLKLNILRLVYSIVIEHEGTVINQTAYFAFIHRRNYSLSDAVKTLGILLRLLPRDSIIIVLKVHYPEVVNRYVKRRSPIEPPYYVSFQTMLYEFLVKHFFKDRAVIIDANKDADKVLNDILKYLLTSSTLISG